MGEFWGAFFLLGAKDGFPPPPPLKGPTKNPPPQKKKIPIGTFFKP